MITTRRVGKEVIEMVDGFPYEVDGQVVTRTIAQDELVISSADGTELAKLDANDPTNQEIIQNLKDSERTREAAKKEHREARLKTYAYLGVAGITAFAILAAASVYSMGGDGNERVKPSGSPIEHARQDMGAEHTEFSVITVHGENDVWYYIEQYAVMKQMPVIEVYSIVTKANPGVDFHKIPKGGKIKVPSI